MSINAVSTTTRNALKRASVYSLPTRPADEGKKEADVKDAMVKPVEMVLDELDRVVTDTNVALGTMQARVNELEETSFETDTLTTAVDYLLLDNKNMTFSAANITAVNIKIPATVGVGFSSQINFATGATVPLVTFENQSSLQVRKIQYGSVVSGYTPSANALVKMLVDCDDGANVLVWINEIK